jgi:nitrate/TMAO reductase-like tetraheme cytochrome c subunit
MGAIGHLTMLATWMQSSTPPAVVQGIHADSLPIDSVVVRSPLPGGVAAVVRYLFNLPRWFQIWGFVAGVLVALAILVLLWRRRRRIVAWFAALPRAMILGLGATAVVIVAGLAVLGRVSWNYTQHNNDFCVSCHVMTTSYERFQRSEHRKLQCHDCHQQSIFASVRQVYYWVAERPAEIPPHAKVPTRVCARCHIQGEADSTWKRVIATAGHSVHLESGNPRLRGVQCVTCHGTELHHFLPVESTCGQSGCHAGIAITLGKMAGQTQLHCVTCHRFTAPVAEHLSPDSAAKVLMPATQECLGCHAMQRVLADFDVTRDPHHGQCGWCHNPHEQRTPAAAFTSCTTADCHARPDTLTPLHRGLHAGVLAKCGDCHEAHTWTVKGTACLQCHRDIFSPSREPRRATRSASRSSSALVDVVAPLWRAAARATPRTAVRAVAAQPLVPVTLAVARVTMTMVQAAARDSLPPFSHRVHRSLSCTTCHRSTQRHGQLTIRSERDCMACHHAPERTAATGCVTCHGRGALTERTTVATVVRTSTSPEPVTRQFPFSHAEHTSVACASCHTTAVTLAPRACTDCHAEHHQGATECRTCHARPPRSAHPRTVHHGCGGSGCHRDAAVLALAPTREVCLVCHQNLVRHQPGRDCAACHATGWSSARSAGSP